MTALFRKPNGLESFCPYVRGNDADDEAVAERECRARVSRCDFKTTPAAGLERVRDDNVVAPFDQFFNRAGVPEFPQRELFAPGLAHAFHTGRRYLIDAEVDFEHDTGVVHVHFNGEVATCPTRIEGSNYVCVLRHRPRSIAERGWR